MNSRFHRKYSDSNARWVDQKPPPGFVWFKSTWAKLKNFKLPPSVSRLSSVFFVFLCVGGFVFQVQTISLVYFQYATATDILISLPDRIQIPDFSLCVRYSDVFDVKSFDPTHQTVDPSEEDTSDNDEEIRDLQKKVTINDIFNFTPNVTELWIRCLSRKINDYNILSTNASKCNEVFKVIKYYVQEYICYNFHQTKSENRTYDFRNIAFSLVFPGIFYGIMLENNGSFRKAEFLRAVVHSHNGLPTESLGLSPGFYRKWDQKKGEAKYNNFQVGYYQLFKNLLRFPFQTNCRDYDKENYDNQNECINSCMNTSVVAKFNKIPFSVFQVDPIGLKHINTADLESDSFTDDLRGIEVECLKSCKQPDCDDSYTLTQVSKEEKANGGGGLSFMISAPRAASFVVTHRALMPMTDYLVYVLSCFGTWFGLSVLSLNPFSWNPDEQKRENRQKDNVCCLETRSELRREMRNDFIQMSRLVAQMKWGNLSKDISFPLTPKLPIYKVATNYPDYPDVRNRFQNHLKYNNQYGDLDTSK